MKNSKKHLVYAEDLLYEIMQYPSRNISKSLVKACTDRVIAVHEVSVWRHIWDTIKGWFTGHD